jgi:hypothetical protein
MIGDHIRTLKSGRWTHAIDCGDETVIVLGDDAGDAPRVRRSYRPEFVAGADAVEVVRHRERTFPAEEVVARAYSRIADPALASMFRDSEAFAEWCTTGRLPPGPRNVAIAVPAPAGKAAPAAAKPVASAPARTAAKPAKAKAKAKASAKAKRATAAATRPVRRAKVRARKAASGAPKRARGAKQPARKPAKRKGRR